MKNCVALLECCGHFWGSIPLITWMIALVFKTWFQNYILPCDCPLLLVLHVALTMVFSRFNFYSKNVFLYVPKGNMYMFLLYKTCIVANDFLYVHFISFVYVHPTLWKILFCKYMLSLLIVSSILFVPKKFTCGLAFISYLTLFIMTKTVLTGYFSVIIPPDIKWTNHYNLYCNIEGCCDWDKWLTRRVIASMLP